MPSITALVALLVACSTEPPPTAPSATPAPTPTDEAAPQAAGATAAGATAAGSTAAGATAAADGHAENHSDLDSLAFTCCKAASATAVVDAFTGLTEAMAADDDAATIQAVRQLTDAATAAGRDDALTDDARRQADAIAMGLKPLNGRSIEDLRAVLASISVEVITFARDNQGGDHKVVSAWCPMAPGHWLQTGAEIRNPYYGAEMLSCGTLEAVDDVQ